jgi:hypothetical protein
MKAQLYFSGCSCGCTPSETWDITADTEEGIIYGLADQMCDCAVYGSNPFRKCYIEALPTGIERSDVREMALKLFELEKQIREKEDERTKKVFKAPYVSAGDEYPLTEEQIAVNDEVRKKFKAEKSAMTRGINKLKEEKKSFHRDYDTEREWYDDDDY